MLLKGVGFQFGGANHRRVTCAAKAEYPPSILPATEGLRARPLLLKSQVRPREQGQRGKPLTFFAIGHGTRSAATRLRPKFLAWYNASSAMAINASLLPPFAGSKLAAPTLTVTMLWPATLV